MSLNINHNELIYAGVDGGGNHCRVCLEDATGNMLGEGLGGIANPGVGQQTTTDSILTAMEQALAQAGLSQKDFDHLVVGAGLAGLHLPSLQNRMEQWHHPFNKLHLTTDLHVAALGAHQGKDGAVIILGTGFSASNVKQGKLTLVGGYGFPINGTGSGAWFGLEAIKAVLLDVDRVGPATQLTQLMLQDKTHWQLAEQMQGATPKAYSRWCPLVFEAALQGDEVAISLIKEAASFVDKVVFRLAEDGATRVAMVGGVTEAIAPWLDAKAQSYLAAPILTPVKGAVHFARQMQQAS